MIESSAITDIDGTTYEVDLPMEKRLEELGLSYSAEDFRFGLLNSTDRALQDFAKAQLADPDFVGSLLPIEGALDAYQRLSQRYAVHAMSGRDGIVHPETITALLIDGFWAYIRDCHLCPDGRDTAKFKVHTARVIQPPPSLVFDNDPYIIEAFAQAAEADSINAPDSGNNLSDLIAYLLINSEALLNSKRYTHLTENKFVIVQPTLASAVDHALANRVN